MLFVCWQEQHDPHYKNCPVDHACAEKQANHSKTESRSSACVAGQISRDG